MKMPDAIENIMLAPCGINCAVCYKHLKKGKPCEGCLKGDAGKTEHCRNCRVKSCAKEKGYGHCFECGDFPCKLITNLEKSYNKRYGVSLVENGKTAREKGVAVFLRRERQKWICIQCGGAVSLHDGECSECGLIQNTD